MMPSRSGDVVTRFLNVDLDICGDANDVADFLKSIEPSALVLNHADRFASIELAEPFASLEETVLGMIVLIGSLQVETRDIWRGLESRRLNLGIQSASAPHSAFFAISAKTVELMAARGSEIVFTVYAPLKDADR